MNLHHSDERHRRGARRLLRLVLLAGIGLPQPLQAQGVLHRPDPLAVEYGFLSNSDMDRAGTVSVEADTVGAFGRRGRSFRSVDTQFNFGYAVTDYLQVGLGPQMTYADVQTVSGMVDARQLLLGGIGADLRLRLVDPRAAPFGLVIQISPQLRFANEGASRGRGTGIMTTIVLDRELIPGRLHGTVNFSHEITRQLFADIGKVEDAMRLGLGAGLAVPVTPALHLGLELRYFRRFDGFGFGGVEGEALYLGPSLYAELGGGRWVALSWQAQIHGREFGKHLPLDLAGFERHQVRLRVGYDF